MKFGDRIIQFRKLFPGEIIIHFRLVHSTKCNSDPIICGCLSLREIDNQTGNIIDIDLSPYANAKKYMDLDTTAWVEMKLPNDSRKFISSPVLVIKVEEGAY